MDLLDFPWVRTWLYISSGLAYLSNLTLFSSVQDVLGIYYIRACVDVTPQARYTTQAHPAEGWAPPT
jgi:hypothetical protein